jgi:uroporphyrinogen-III synthase
MTSTLSVQTRPVLVLRPEPGAIQTAEKLRQLGVVAIAAPLFTITAIEWAITDPADYDALLLTSANAVRLAGAQLAAVAHLPCWCVGEVTATAARGAGLPVVRTGIGGVDALLADTTAPMRMLWLAGQEHHPATPPAGVHIVPTIVYAARPSPIDPAEIAGPAIALLHSARAAERLSALVSDRSMIEIVAISTTVASAAGTGWAAVHIANQPSDSEMVAMAAKLCQKQV